MVLWTAHRGHTLVCGVFQRELQCRRKRRSLSPLWPDSFLSFCLPVFSGWLFGWRRRVRMPPKKVVEEERLGPWCLGKFSRYASKQEPLGNELMSCSWPSRD